MITSEGKQEIPRAGSPIRLRESDEVDGHGSWLKACEAENLTLRGQ